MKGLIIANDFYVSKFLMKDMDRDVFDYVFENDFYSRVSNKTFSRIKAFWPSSPGAYDHVLAFAIENIIVLDQIYRKVGKPKVWLWNPVSSMTKKNKRLFLSYIKCKSIEVWTFDKGDVELYGFMYHNQIHSCSLIQKNKPLYQRAFFSGVDKGRLNVIKNIKNELDLIPINTDVHIVRDKSSIYLPSDISITTDSYLSFERYLNEVECSSILIDVTQSNQQGVTLRVIEALFMNRKLITTNVDVLSLEFYSLENIYIYGHEKNRTLKEFVESPLCIIKDSVKFKYTLNHLLKEMFC